MIWVGHLISFAVILQSLEFFWIPFYRADLIAPEFPRALRWTLRLQQWVVALRLLAAVSTLIFPSTIGVTVLVLTSWWIALRWRGTFNGGSDFMTFHILAAWLISLSAPQLEKICLYYIVIQLLLSYFVAGVAKLSNREWRNGLALKSFLGRWDYNLALNWCRLLSWLTVTFEILFPLALFMPFPFMALGLLFHLANAYIFGLNRFFWAWLAAYPALWSTHPSSVQLLELF